MRALIIALVFWTSTVWAVEPPRYDGNRFALVGIVGNTDQANSGVVVLKDIARQKTVTVRMGEQVPGEEHFRLVAMDRKFVTLSDGLQKIIVTHELAPKTTEAEEAAEPQTSQISGGSLSDEEWDLFESKLRQVIQSSPLSSPPPVKTWSSTSFLDIEHDAADCSADEADCDTEGH